MESVTRQGLSRSFWEVVGGKREGPAREEQPGGREDGKIGLKEESEKAGNRTVKGNVVSGGGAGGGSTGRGGTAGIAGAGGAEGTVKKISKDKPGVKKRPTCYLCGSNFTRSYDVKRHINQVHGRRQGYPCDLCDLNLSKRLDLNEHIQKAHGSVEVYNCPYCRKAFGDMERYRDHVAKSHFKEDTAITELYSGGLVERDVNGVGRSGKIGSSSEGDRNPRERNGGFDDSNSLGHITHKGGSTEARKGHEAVRL